MAVSGSDAPPEPAQRRLPLVLGGLAVVVLLVLLRLPTLFEPAWTSDAGAYANIGRSLDLGGVLYSGIWDNKPPGLYWLSALITAGGASALGMQIALSVIVAGSTLLVFLLVRRLAATGTALVAAGIFAVLASVPNFSGDQLNAEIVGALPVLGAMVVLLRRAPIRPGQAVLGGTLLGVALLFKAPFVADVLAGLAIPALSAVALRGRPSRADLLTTLLVLGGVLLTCAAAAVALALHGSLAGLVDVLVHQGPNYAAWGQLAGPTGVPPPTYGAEPSALLRAVAASRLLVVVAGGALVAVLLARRGRRGGAVVSFWLACDLAATMLDNRALTHYVQQSTAALAVAAALLAAELWRQRSTAARALALLALPAVWATLLGVLYLPRAEAAVATGHRPPQLSLENSSGRQLPDYYRRAARLLTGRISLDEYHRAFEGSVYPADEALARLLHTYSRPGQRVFIWGELSAWAYAFADRLPASRFVWQDSAYHLYPDAEATLLADLERSPPAVLIAEQPLSPRLREFLQGHGYNLASTTPQGACWVAPG